MSDHSPTIPTKLPGSPRVNNGEDVASCAPKTFFHAKHSEMALHSISGSVWNTNGLHTVTYGYIGLQYFWSSYVLWFAYASITKQRSSKCAKFCSSRSNSLSVRSSSCMGASSSGNRDTFSGVCGKVSPRNMAGMGIHVSDAVAEMVFKKHIEYQWRNEYV